MSLTVTIGGVTCPVMPGVSIKKRVSLRSTCDLTVVDLTASLTISENMACFLSETTLGTLFVGYVDKVGQTKAAGTSPALFRQITLKDVRWLADKRLFTSADYKTSRLAGDILCDLHTQYLSAEGVVSAFAQRYDKDATTWGAGTLTNVSGATGALQLASAGSTVTISENTSAVFNGGTGAGTTGANNRLTLAPFSAIKMTGYSAQGQGASNNNYYYVEIWNGSSAIDIFRTVNPTLQYTIWISSTSPAIVGGIDFICTDGTTLRSQGLADQLGIQAHPATDLSGYANDQHYSRTIDLHTLSGKTISSVMLALEGDPAGVYTLYCSTIGLYDGNGTLQTTFFSNTLNAYMPLSNVGYSKTALTVATVYPSTGQRVSNNYSIAAAGLARSSLVTWQQVLLNADGTTTTLADNAQGTNSTPYITIEVSLDAQVTWQTISNHAALSALMAGVNLGGQTLNFRQTLNVAGTNPEITPALTGITASIFPSYQATKTDSRTSYVTTWNGSGTLTNAAVSTDGLATLQLQGAWRNWNDGVIANQLAWGTGTPTQKVIAGQFLVNNTGPNNDVRSQFSFAGTWGPHLAGASTGITMDVDFYINSFGNYGMVYGTTNWNNANNTFAYEVDCTTTTLTLGRGSNAGSSGTFTNIATQALGLTAGEWHHMTVIWFFAGGGNYQHLIYIDNVLYINVFDNTFTAVGYFGSRFFNTSSANHSAFVDNFGVVAATSGTWVSNAVNLSSVGTAGNSLIMWNQSTPNGTAVLVEVSLNNGGTYTTCTNNAALPGIANGTNVSAITQMRIRITLSTNSASYTPSVSGLTTWVMGQYNASGTRIAPVLALGGVGTAGSTSVVWNSTTPTSTGVLVDTSPDTITYTNIAASGNAIPNITTQPDPTIDDFLTNTSANYTQSSGTWTWETANQRLVATGGPGKMVYTSITAANSMGQTIMDYADSAGLVARWTNNTNTYVLILHDASSTSPNTAILTKIVGGTTTQLGSAAISFTRGTYHTPTLLCVGTTISVQFDGTQIISVTDASLSSGKMGFHVDTRGQFYTLWISPFGQSLTGQNIFSRVRLTSTDPTVTPSVSDLTVSVRSPEIDNGASIPNTSWSYSNTLGSAIDDLAKKSNAWWGFTTAKHAAFQTRLATLAPWPLASANGTDLMGYVDPSVSYNSPSYRNRQYVLGATTTQIIPENKIGDGSTQSWALGYPVAPTTTPTITVGNATQVVGLQGATGGPFDFTYTPGTSGGGAGTIIQSASATPPAPNVVIAVSYSAITPVTVVSNSVSQQTLLAGFDGSTGIVEAVETIAGLTQTAAQQLADARIAQYANLIRGWQFTTRRDGLAPGQILYVFVPELNMPKVPFLITEDAITLQLESPAGVEIVKQIHSISATEGPPTQYWTRLFTTPQ